MSSIVPLHRELLNTHQTHAETGIVSTEVPDVHFFWSRKASARNPLLYNAGIVIIGQGHKVGYLDGRTGDSPLQYQKKIRLNKAKSLLVHENMRVNTAAYEVGYESPSQFSREFKRYFNMAPSEVYTTPYGYAV